MSAGSEHEQRWEIRVRQPEPNETFSASLLTSHPLFGARWIAEVYEDGVLAAVTPAMFRRSAIYWARSFIKSQERAERSEKWVKP